jgi:hypothetical protein
MMSLSVRNTVRLLAVGVAIAVISVAFLPGSSGAGPYASILDDSGHATPVAKKCANTICNSWCWIDGCVHNPQTQCRRTVMQPLECPSGTGGCLASAC